MRSCATAILLLCLAAGCGTFRPWEREVAVDALFVPVGMTIHPIFTQVRDWTGDGHIDGIEALIEFQDRFDDPAKAAGVAVFELYEYRDRRPDPRGERVAGPWVHELLTLGDQRRRWSSTSRTYAFELPYRRMDTRRPHVLTASFELADGHRFFDRIIIDAQRDDDARPSANDLPEPTTQPDEPAEP